jgi:Helicase HerA, central domain
MLANRSNIKNKAGCRYYKRPSLHDPKYSGQIFNNPRDYQIKGDIRLGYVQNSKMVFGLLQKELVKHLLVCGASGAGKSNFLRVLQVELNRLNIPFIVFDTAKLGSRFLKKYMNDLIVLRWDKEFCFNPLQPPKGVKFKEWLMVFSEITTEVFGLRTASKLYLTEFVQNLMPEDLNTSRLPTMHGLNQKLEARLQERIPINERGYLNGIQSKIKTVCITLEEMINVQKGIPIEKLLKYPLCIELVGIKSSEIQYWIISLIMAAISSYREARPMSFGSLRHVFFIDEAAHIVGKEGDSFVISCIRRLREYGEGIVLADQCISTINEVVKSNTYTTIGMSQIGQKDRREMISVLGLNSNQAQTINFLNVGQGIVRLGGRYPFPQLIKFPFIKPENISDKELDKINAQDPKVLDLLCDVESVNTADTNSVNSSPKIPRYTFKREQETRPDQMLEKSKDMLLDIYNRFDVASTVRASDFGLSGSASDKIFKYIEQKKLVDVVRVNLTGGRGGTSKFYVLTNPKGYQAISKAPVKRSGGTGAMHFFLERYLEKHLPEKGFSELEIEKNINGKRIDLFGKYNELKVGIEICVSTIKTEFINVQKDIDKCDFLIITTPDKKTLKKLEAELYKKVEPSKKLKTCVVHELLNFPEKIIIGGAL